MGPTRVWKPEFTGKVESEGLTILVWGYNFFIEAFFVVHSILLKCLMLNWLEKDLSLIKCSQVISGTSLKHKDVRQKGDTS